MNPEGAPRPGGVPPCEVSFIVPALNESKNLRGTLADIAAACRGRVVGYEVLVVDDGSTDGTSDLADILAREDSRVRALHNVRRLGYGGSFFRGLDAARGERVMLVPGDGEVPQEAVASLLDARHRADIVLPIMSGGEARPLVRRSLSRAYVLLLNRLLGLNAHYYTGQCLLPRRAALSVPFRDHGHTFMAGLVAPLLFSGFSCAEAPNPLRYLGNEKSRAITARNAFLACRLVLRVLWWAYCEGGPPRAPEDGPRP